MTATGRRSRFGETTPHGGVRIKGRQLVAVGAILPLVLLGAGCGTTVSQGEQAVAGSMSPGVGVGGAVDSSGAGTPGAGTPLGAGSASTPVGSVPNGLQPGGSSTATGNAPSESSPQTKAFVTRPLIVGLLGTGAVGGAASAIGANENQGVTPSQALQAVAKSYQNGIAGRRVRTVVAEINPSGDYQQQLNTACAKFTQDNHVDVVISTDAPNDEIMATCLNRARVPRISTAYGSGNAAYFTSYPLSRHVGAPNADRRMATLISRSAAAGTLTKTSRVGVIVEDCPRNHSVYDQTVAPALKNVGVAVVVTQFTKCVNGFSDAGSASTAMSSAVLNFASRRVETVMFVSNFEGTLLLFFSQAAEGQGYRPHYALTSAAGVATLHGSVPANQLRNMAGWGWLPSIDVTHGNTASTSPQRSCLSRLAKGGRNPQSNVDYLAAYAACDGFTALEHALQGSRGDSSAERLLSALDAASASVSLTSLVDGRIVLSAGRHDGPSRVRAFSYQSACGCFAYVGSSQDMAP